MTEAMFTWESRSFELYVWETLEVLNNDPLTMTINHTKPKRVLKVWNCKLGKQSF